MSKHVARAIAIVALVGAASTSGLAQSRAIVTVADYERAERFLNYNTNPLVSDGPVRANWLPDDRFWYRNQTAAGFEFVLVDPDRATKTPAFDHAAIAGTLTTAMGKTVTAAQLPFQTITFDAGLQSFSFDNEKQRWTCDVRGKACTAADRPESARNSVLSPDRKHAAFIR